MVHDRMARCYEQSVHLLLLQIQLIALALLLFHDDIIAVTGRASRLQRFARRLPRRVTLMEIVRIARGGREIGSTVVDVTMSSSAWQGSRNEAHNSDHSDEYSLRSPMRVAVPTVSGSATRSGLTLGGSAPFHVPGPACLEQRAECRERASEASGARSGEARERTFAAPAVEEGFPVPPDLALPGPALSSRAAQASAITRDFRPPMVCDRTLTFRYVSTMTSHPSTQPWSAAAAADSNALVPRLSLRWAV